MPTPEEFARGGIVLGPDRPRRFWRYPASQLTYPKAFQVFRGTDEFHNPTLAVGLPYVGMWVAVTRWRLNTVPCNEDHCQEPECETAEFYQQRR